MTCRSSEDIRHEKELILAELRFGPRPSDSLAMILFLGERAIEHRLKSLKEDGLVAYKHQMWWRIK
jgi:predicted transcriptional regulator